MRDISAITVKKNGKVKVLIFGGKYNNQGKVYTLDLETMESGTVGSDVCYRRYGHSNSSINNDVYLFGGNWKYSYQNDLQKFDIENEALEKVQTVGKPPSPRRSHGSSVIGNILYVFGGYGDEEGTLNDLHSFNSVSKQWSEIQVSSEKPFPRDGMSVFGFQDKLYLFGGYSNKGALNDFHVFDLKTKSWRELVTNSESSILNPTSTASTTMVPSSGNDY